MLIHVTGGVMGSWELHYVNLDVKQKARVIFGGVKGKNPSKGGFSLDDINLSSTSCPQHIWHIRNISNLLATTPPGTKTYSPRFLSPSGYSFQVKANNYYTFADAASDPESRLHTLFVYGP